MKNKALCLASLLRAETETDRLLQFTLLRAMAEAITSGEELDSDAFSLLVEDNVTDRALSSRRAAKLVLDTGAFAREDGIWTYEAPQIDRGKSLGWAEFTALFQEDSATSVAQRAETVSSVEQAIRSAIGWSVDMTLLAQRSGQIDGQPAFYTCEEDGDRIIGFKVAGTATSDSLSMLCHSVEDLSACGKTPEELHKALSFLLEKTLACQCREDGWDFGGFYPLEDQPDAQHPTVDATCLALMAICDYLEKQDSLTALTGQPCDEDPAPIMHAVLDGLEFLFRMQNPEGSFSIYRFESGLNAQANENCTRTAQSTMGVCKGSGIFDRLGREDLYPRCSQVIAGTWSYLTENAAKDEGRTLWAPYYGKSISDYRAADVLVSTARVDRALIPVWWQIESARPQIITFWRALADFWSDHVQEAEKDIGFYRFSTPTENAFSSGEYAWASHPDMLTAFTLLQAHNLFGFRLSERNWALIEAAVRHTLSLQHPHGHWDNPLAQKTPFCAVTLAAIELLREYRSAKQQ